MAAIKDQLNAMLREQMDTLEGKLQSSAEELQEMMDAVSGKVTALKQQHDAFADSVSAQVSTQQTELSTATENMLNNSERIDEAVERIEDLDGQLQTALSQIEALRDGLEDRPVPEAAPVPVAVPVVQAAPQPGRVVEHSDAVIERLDRLQNSLWLSLELLQVAGKGSRALGVVASTAKVRWGDILASEDNQKFFDDFLPAARAVAKGADSIVNAIVGPDHETGGGGEFNTKKVEEMVDTKARELLAKQSSAESKLRREFDDFEAKFLEEQRKLQNKETILAARLEFLTNKLKNVTLDDRIEQVVNRSMNAVIDECVARMTELVPSPEDVDDAQDGHLAAQLVEASMLRPIVDRLQVSVSAVDKTLNEVQERLDVGIGDLQNDVDSLAARVGDDVSERINKVYDRMNDLFAEQGIGYQEEIDALDRKREVMEKVLRTMDAKVDDMSIMVRLRSEPTTAAASPPRHSTAHHSKSSRYMYSSIQHFEPRPIIALPEITRTGDGVALADDLSLLRESTGASLDELRSQLVEVQDMVVSMEGSLQLASERSLNMAPDIKMLVSILPEFKKELKEAKGETRRLTSVLDEELEVARQFQQKTSRDLEILQQCIDNQKLGLETLKAKQGGVGREVILKIEDELKGHGAGIKRIDEATAAMWRGMDSVGAMVDKETGRVFSWDQLVRRKAKEGRPATKPLTLHDVVGPTWFYEGRRPDDQSEGYSDDSQLGGRMSASAEAVRELQAEMENCYAAIADLQRTSDLFTGKVVDVERGLEACQEGVQHVASTVGVVEALALGDHRKRPMSTAETDTRPGTCDPGREDSSRAGTALSSSPPEAHPGLVASVTERLANVEGRINELDDLLENNRLEMDELLACKVDIEDWRKDSADLRARLQSDLKPIAARPRDKVDPGGRLTIRNGARRLPPAGARNRGTPASTEFSVGSQF
mmetsp:Transcript_89431/g.239704  ORF Transcript_89431/g.239704 Transcript_89431/m.239704 type:complete len:940 (+) Transcript_89431:854-3673(+)